MFSWEADRYIYVPWLVRTQTALAVLILLFCGFTPRHFSVPFMSFSKSSLFLLPALLLPTSFSLQVSFPGFRSCQLGLFWLFVCSSHESTTTTKNRKIFFWCLFWGLVVEWDYYLWHLFAISSMLCLKDCAGQLSLVP